MENKTQHTPTPWQWYWREEEQHPNCGIFSEQYPGHAYAVARCPHYQKRERWEADAILIVEAANSYVENKRKLEAFDAVLEALRGLTIEITLSPKHSGMTFVWLDKARAAIKLAEGK